jgi:hypothetical protein
VYDYLLGGKDHCPADREFAEQMLQAHPDARDDARHNRDFMRRAVTFLAKEAGMRQFLDIGAGLTAPPNVHEVVQQISPASRVVYVRNDPTVMAHARALLVGGPAGVTEYVQADARDPDRILAEAARVLDLSQPVALTMIALLHYLSNDDDPYRVVAELLSALPSGSYLALSHGTHDLVGEDRRRHMQRLGNASPVRSQVRSRAEIERFFTGLELVDPGVVSIVDWRPGHQDAPRPAETAFWAGVARVP